VKALHAIWDFVAGGSRVTPVATAVAVVVTLLLLRAGVAGPLAGAALAVIVALGLTAAVCERA